MIRVLVGAAVMIFALATLDANNSLFGSYYCTQTAEGIISNRCYNGLFGIAAMYIFAAGAGLALYGLITHKLNGNTH